eukprot:Phypoly_transcript_09460.p1 GENE.Phypoly_transcript_09460~~Phypoly_transcript_09460.p1  ORF type:complete len:432 (+),score=101.66 Phypoly_transcript_09460:75-1370(+)
MIHTSSHEPMTISAELSTVKPHKTNHTHNMGKYINCIASEDMKITGSGEFDGSPRILDPDKRLSWRGSAYARDELGHRRLIHTETPNGIEVHEGNGASIHVITPGEGATLESFAHTPLGPITTTTTPDSPTITPNPPTTTSEPTNPHISTPPATNPTTLSTSPSTTIPPSPSLRSTTPPHTVTVLASPTNPHNTTLPTNPHTTETSNTEPQPEKVSTNTPEIHPRRTPTPGTPTLGTPRLGRPRVGSKVIQMRKSLDLDPVLAEAMEQVKAGGAGGGGGGGTDLMDQAANHISAILLHATKQPPPSPQHTALTHSTSSNLSHTSARRKSLRLTRELKPVVMEEEEEGQPSELELQEIASMGQYPDIEPYEPDTTGEQTVMVGEGEEIVKVNDGVGANIGEPKADNMVRKEIVRITVVAIVALLVVLLFVLT